MILLIGCGRGGDGGGGGQSRPAVAAPGTAAKVLFTATADRDVTKEQYRLFGVAADGATAYVLRERRLDDPPLWSLDTIDLKGGTRSATWETQAQREYVQLLPVGGTVEEAAVRFAALAAATGPWSTRAAAHWIEAQPVEDGMVYRASALTIADRAGKAVRELGEAGEVRVSPDGKRVLWTEDIEPLARRLAVAAVAGGDPVLGPDRGWLREPMWSSDGASIYAVEDSAEQGKEPCLVRFAATDLAGTSLACLAGTQPSVAQAPDGATLAFMVKTGGASTALWIDAATGRERATRTGLPSLAPQLEDVLLSDRGWLVSISADWTALVAVDLASGKVASLPAGPDSFWEGVRATRWQGGAIVVLRRRAAAVELVRVDVATMLGT